MNIIFTLLVLVFGFCANAGNDERYLSCSYPSWSPGATTWSKASSLSIRRDVFGDNKSNYQVKINLAPYIGWLSFPKDRYENDGNRHIITSRLYKENALTSYHFELEEFVKIEIVVEYGGPNISADLYLYRRDSSFEMQHFFCN